MFAWNYRRQAFTFFVSRSRSVARRVRVQAFVCVVCDMCGVWYVWCVICVVCVYVLCRVLCRVSCRACVLRGCACVLRVCGMGVLCLDVEVCWAVSLCVVLACVLGCVLCVVVMCAFLLVLHRQRTWAFWTYTRERFQRTHGSVYLFSSRVSLLSCLPLSSHVSLFLSLLSQ